MINPRKIHARAYYPLKSLNQLQKKLILKSYMDAN